MKLSRSRLLRTVIANEGNPIVPWWRSTGIPLANCIAAYQPIGAADYATSKLNLINPSSHILVDTGHVPAWDTTKGWVGAGTNLYLTSDIVPVKNSTLIVRFSDWISGSQALIVETGKYYGVGFAFTGNWRFGNGNLADIAMGANNYGTLAVSGLRTYIDGVFKGLITDSMWTTLNHIHFMIRITNTDSGIIQPLNGNLAAAAYYDATFTDDVIAGLHTAMMALPSVTELAQVQQGIVGDGEIIYPSSIG